MIRAIRNLIVVVLELVMIVLATYWIISVAFFDAPPVPALLWAILLIVAVPDKEN